MYHQSTSPKPDTSQSAYPPLLFISGILLLLLRPSSKLKAGAVVACPRTLHAHLTPDSASLCGFGYLHSPMHTDSVRVGVGSGGVFHYPPLQYPYVRIDRCSLAAGTVDWACSRRAVRESSLTKGNQNSAKTGRQGAAKQG